MFETLFASSDFSFTLVNTGYEIAATMTTIPTTTITSTSENPSLFFNWAPRDERLGGLVLMLDRNQRPIVVQQREFRHPVSVQGMVDGCVVDDANVDACLG